MGDGRADDDDHYWETVPEQVEDYMDQYKDIIDPQEVYNIEPTDDDTITRRPISVIESIWFD